MTVRLDPEILLAAYSQGAFPMASESDGQVRWYTADPRGILPLASFHCSKNLAQLVRQRKFDVRSDTAFAEVMRLCMDVPREKSPGSWISPELIAAYAQLHRLGFAHSVEAWRDGQLVGGLYGVSLGGAFFGESMFALETNASKVCLVHLVDRLKRQGYALLDTQMVTSHMRQFGTKEIPAAEYMKMLESALAIECQWQGERRSD